MIFGDSSFWVAAIRPRDEHHQAADRLADTVSSRMVVTSNLVVGETWTFLRRRERYELAMKWLRWLRSNQGVRVDRVHPDIEDEAWSWLETHDERTYSFVDATSFALMRRLRIREALAFDGDFAAAGFIELRA